MADNNYTQIKNDFQNYLVEQKKISKYKKITTKQILTTYNEEFKKFLQTRNDINEETFQKML